MIGSAFLMVLMMPGEAGASEAADLERYERGLKERRERERRERKACRKYWQDRVECVCQKVRQTSETRYKYVTRTMPLAEYIFSHAWARQKRTESYWIEDPAGLRHRGLYDRPVHSEKFEVLETAKAGRMPRWLCYRLCVTHELRKSKSYEKDRTKTSYVDVAVLEWTRMAPDLKVIK